MRITPIRFVRDVEASRAFYAVLGLAERTEATSGTWADLGAAGGSLGLHVARHPGTHDDAGAVALQFTSDERLDAVAERLAAAGYEPSPIVDETFGRFFTVQDPDGYRIQVNEADEDLQGLSYEIRESAALKP
ncbi:VOC family protein [Arthrobacter sp. KBS0702]|uniref:VOC family protein n=1 Tax=Arthrobacter sp. KBS0702 TaxID=2578107 RepID=UPI00110DB26B|nr:VOC family protein [Arthrobacter sp. KBS0702]QDW30991.1 VOC family protein [Arthrobacter sp. KBS0702]